MLTDNDRINNSYDTVTWERMVAIKQRVLQIWDTATPTVRICCIKFAQRVVLAQTVSSMGDHRVCCSHLGGFLGIANTVIVCWWSRHLPRQNPSQPPNTRPSNFRGGSIRIIGPDAKRLARIQVSITSDTMYRKEKS